MCAVFAIRSGLRDAREGRTPFFRALFAEAPRRREIVRDGWRDAGRIFLLAVAIDLVYQAAVLRAFRPGEAAIVGVLLGIVPYAVVRGATNRVARRVCRRAQPPKI